MSECIRVTIVEDVDEVREGIRRVLEQDEEITVREVFDCAEDMLKSFRADLYDVALIDIKLPGQSGIELIARVKAIDPDLEAMMLTVLDDDRRVFESIRAGASGYLLKTASNEQIIGGIRELYKGGAVMSGRIARRVINFLRPNVSADVLTAGITQREWEVLELLAQGASYKDLAQELSISMHTVRSHVHKIYEKLHVKNRAQAVKKVRKSLAP